MELEKLTANLYTVKETAALLKISVKTLRLLIKNNEINHVMIGKNYRIKFNDIIGYINRAK